MNVRDIRDIEKHVAEWNATKEATVAKLAELEAEMASVQDQ